MLFLKVFIFVFFKYTYSTCVRCDACAENFDALLIFLCVDLEGLYAAGCERRGRAGGGRCR